MDPLDTVKHHLENTDDPTLLILRAHLLVEERLREILARISRSRDELPGARLSFYQVLMLCRAVVGRHDEPAWGFVARLNEVRNRMAHHLDPGDLDGRNQRQHPAQGGVCTRGRGLTSHSTRPPGSHALAWVTGAEWNESLDT